MRRERQHSERRGKKKERGLEGNFTNEKLMTVLEFWTPPV